ncbi:primary-amine oxidase [Colletotrichum asianum]
MAGGGLDGRLFAVEAVAVQISIRSKGIIRGDSIILHDCIARTIDLGIDAERKDVLMVVGVDGRGHLRAERGDDLGNDELAVAGGNNGTVTVVGMLVQKPVVFFMDTDGILHDSCLSRTDSHNSVHVVDDTLAITTKLEGVGHEARAILAHVEGMLAVVGRVRVAVGNDHLDHTDAVEEVPLTPLIVNADVRKNDTLAVVKANMHLQSRPEELATMDLERDALGLSDIDGLELILVTLADEFGQIVVLLQRDLGPLAIHESDIDSQDFSLFGIDYD